MPHGFWGCHFAKGGAVIPSEFYSGVPNSAGCHILCDMTPSHWCLGMNDSPVTGA